MSANMLILQKVLEKDKEEAKEIIERARKKINKKKGTE